MNRKRNAATIAGLAGLALAGSTFAQTATPQTGNYNDGANNLELIGGGTDNSNVYLRVLLAGITATGAAAVDGDFAIAFRDAAGAIILNSARPVLAANLTEIAAFANAGEIDAGDVWQIDVSGFVAARPANAVELVLLYNENNAAGDSAATDANLLDAGGAQIDAEQLLLADNADPNLDTEYDIIADRPTLVSAFFEEVAGGGVNDNLFLVFNVPQPASLNNNVQITLAQADGVAPNVGDNPNDTANTGGDTDGNATALGQNAFQVDEDNDGTFQNVGFAVAPTLGNGQTFIVIPFDNTVAAQSQELGTTAVGNGGTIRVSANSAGVVFDEIGNRVTAGAVAIQNLPSFTITSVEFQQRIVTAGAVANAVRVVFNLPVDPADLGNAAFYGGFLKNPDGTNTDLQITGVAADPADPNAVFLTVTGNATDRLYADGLNQNGQQLSITTSTAGDVPSILFNPGGNQFSDDTTIVGQDFIAPTVEGFAYTDTNGDGVIDSGLIIFDEAIAIPGTTTAADFTLRKSASTVQPIFQILPNGQLVNDQVTAAGTAADDITISSLTTVDGRTVTAGIPARLQLANALAISFDPFSVDWDGVGGTVNNGQAQNTEALPGSGGSAGGNFLLVGFGANAVSVQDTTANANTNTLAATPALPAGTPFALDRANPLGAVVAFFTGDNQQITLDGNPAGEFNTQFWREIARGGAGAGTNDTLGNPAGLADVGDQVLNNRLATFWSETVAAPGIDPTNVLVDGLDNVFDAVANFGASFPHGQFADPGFTNNITFGFDGSGAERPSVLTPTSLISVRTTANIVDGAGNTGSFDDVAASDRTAPYLTFFSEADATPGFAPTVRLSAILEDGDTDGFADNIRLQMSAGVSLAALDTDPTGGFDDFDVEDTTVTGVGTEGGVDSSVINVAINDGDVSMAATADVTYNSNNTIVGLNGISPTVLPVNGVTDANALATAASILQPNIDGQTPAVMIINGTGTQNGVALPQGTVIFGTVAIPTVVQLDFTWNNLDVEFDIWDADQTAGALGAVPSMAAFTDFLLGMEEELYLQRGDFNNLTFTNEFNGAAAGGALTTGDGEATAQAQEDIIEVEVNSRNLNRVTFSGNGQKGEKRTLNRLRNGSATLAWDVMRSGDGSFARFADGDTGGGYVAGGVPVLSRAVIDNNNGTFTINVAGPTSAFNGNNVLGSIGFPVILVAQLPNGQRFALSALNASANAANNFNPVLFDAEVETSDQAQNGDQAADGASAFAFDIATNINTEFLFGGWNLLSYGLDNGWASSTANVPDVLTAGLTDANADGTPDNTFVSSALPAAGALEQFAYFFDRDSVPGDRIWTAADDTAATAELDSILIDLGTMDTFAFTMTDRGVQFGDGINSFVGGYAAGVFMTSGANAGAVVGAQVGVFQFGTNLNDLTTAGNGITNNTTTLGWSLVTVTNDLGFATEADFFTNNGSLDYFIVLDNQGPSSTASSRIDIRSAANGGGLAADATDDAVGDNTAGFTHVVAPN